ncbi:substrate-binding domain-containing protein [Botrimarina sp.]|uniref:sugar ABC transporter substrate-binding protein n=1 Tax=Botrimarina sp. TaxID=2795802 RepID=UPI0032EB6BCC
MHRHASPPTARRLCGVWLFTPSALMTQRTALTTLSLMLSVAIGVAVSASGDRGAPTPVGGRERPLIGLSLGTLAEERWRRDRDLFVARAEELGADVLTLAGSGDGMRQNRDVEALISRGVGALVIVAFDPAAMSKAVASARARGIPVVCYDRMITDCDVDLYVSFNNFEVGRLQAEYLVQNTPPGARIVRISGPKTDHTAQMFRRGQDSVLGPLVESGAVVLLRDDYASGWRPDEAKKIVAAAITEHGDAIDGVLATNDGCAGGAVQALLEEGIAGRVVVTGQDADLAACQRIARGHQTMSVYKPLERLATAAADAAVAFARGRTVVARDQVDNGFERVPAILEEAVVVDRLNLRSTVVDSGFHPAEALE